VRKAAAGDPGPERILSAHERAASRSAIGAASRSAIGAASRSAIGAAPARDRAILWVRRRVMRTRLHKAVTLILD